jgi:putative flippase GtrA
VLATIAWISIILAFICAAWIALDIARHPQSMTVMNVVWPVSGLYFSVIALWAYYRVGRAKSKEATLARENGQNDARRKLTAWQIAIGTSHCAAGCMLADVFCEFAIAAAGLTLFGSVLWAEYVIDFAAAWALGIVFQYFAIQPMRHLPFGEGLTAAIKADTLSILAFQIGMYTWMAITFFLLFSHPHLDPFDPRYWLMMQIAMICGFATSYPVNRWLIRVGLKEVM